MKFEDRLKREDSLASWRLATLLTFNGFLVVAITEINKDLLTALSVVGIIYSLSVLGVSVLSAIAKRKLSLSWPEIEGTSPIGSTKNAFKYYSLNALGPYMLCPIILTAFWGCLLFSVFFRNST